MKRFILVTLFLSFFGFSSAFANWSPDLSIPYVHEGITYTDVVAYKFYFNGQERWNVFYVNMQANFKLINNGNNVLYIQNHNGYANAYGYVTASQPEWWVDNIPGLTNQSFFGIDFLSDIHSSQPIYNQDDSIYFDADLGGPEPQLVVTIDPLDGGNVEVDEVACTTCPCVYNLDEVNQSSIHATANTGYAFGYWKETINPYSVTPSGDKSMTAKFFKTFRNAVGDFYADIDDTGGECIVYVRSETGIDYDACHGDAMDCFSLAKAAGYSTGSEPKEGAIAVFSRDTFPDVGHVGIVKEIVSGTSITLRHSNYLTYHIVGEDTINLTTHPVMGYIYPTP